MGTKKTSVTRRALNSLCRSSCSRVEGGERVQTTWTCARTCTGYTVLVSEASPPFLAICIQPCVWVSRGLCVLRARIYLLMFSSNHLSQSMTAQIFREQHFMEMLYQSGGSQKDHFEITWESLRHHDTDHEESCGKILSSHALIILKRRLMFEGRHVCQCK